MGAHVLPALSRLTGNSASAGALLLDMPVLLSVVPGPNKPPGSEGPWLRPGPDVSGATLPRPAINAKPNWQF